MFARRAIFVTACLAAFSVTACNSSRPSPGKIVGSGDRAKVAVVSNNAEEFWTICEAGAKKAAAEINAELFFRKPATGSAAEQRDIIEDLLVQGVNGVAISVNDPKNQINFLNRVA